LYPQAGGGDRQEAIKAYEQRFGKAELVVAN